MQKESKVYVVISGLLIISIAVFLLTIKINSVGNVILEEETLPIALMIGDNTGFDVDTSVLTFGMVTTDTSSSRKLTLENSYPFSVRYSFRAEGDVAGFLIFKESVILESGEKKDFGISTIIFGEEPKGNYSGTMFVEVKRVVD